MYRLLKAVFVVGTFACQPVTMASTGKTTAAAAVPTLFDPQEVLEPSPDTLAVAEAMKSLRPGMFQNKLEDNVPFGVHTETGVGLVKDNANSIKINVAPGIEPIATLASTSTILGDLVWTGKVQDSMFDRVNLIVNKEGGLYGSVNLMVEGEPRHFEIVPSELSAGYSVVFEYMPPNLPD